MNNADFPQTNEITNEKIFEDSPTTASTYWVK